MSCDRRCFDNQSSWFDHDDCATCPGADAALPKNWIDQSDNPGLVRLRDAAQPESQPQA